MDELVADNHVDHNPAVVAGLAPGREGWNQAEGDARRPLE
jgi:hypothetical protein